MWSRTTSHRGARSGRRTSTARARAAAAATLAVLAACADHVDEAALEDDRPVPPDARVLRVRFPLGSVTVHPSTDGRLHFSGRSRKSATSAEGLERLREVDFVPTLAAVPDEPGVYLYSLPGVPEGAPRGSVLMLRAQLQLPRGLAVDVETRRGNLGVVGRDADVRLKTGSGALQLEDIDGDVDVTTGLGGAILHRIRGSVTVESGGGALLAFIDEIGANGIRMRTADPSIALRLPADAGFDLDARVLRTNAGKVGVRNAFGVPVIEAPSTEIVAGSAFGTVLEAAGLEAHTGHAAVGEVAGGGPPVVLQTERGWISVTTLAEPEFR